MNVYTSQSNWLAVVAKNYKNKATFTLVDDRNLGIDPLNDTLYTMGRKANLSTAEWTAVGVSLGISAAGMAIIILAFLDPEPTTKLGLMIGVGGVCILGGGFSAIKILTKTKPPKVTVSAIGFSISWD